jgi:hypothetical protein
LEMFEYRWQDLLNMAMNLWVPKNINFLLSWATNTSQEFHGGRPIEKRVLRKISEPRRKELTGNWRKLRTEKLHALYSSPHKPIIKVRVIMPRTHHANATGRRGIATTHYWPRHYMRSVVSVTPRPRFNPGKDPPPPIGQEAGWASGLAWSQRLEEKFFASGKARIRVIQSVVTYYIDWTASAVIGLLLWWLYQGWDRRCV